MGDDRATRNIDQTSNQTGRRKRRSAIGMLALMVLASVGAAGLVFTAEPARATEAPATVPGLLGEYFHDDNLSEPAFERIDPTVDFEWGLDAPDPRLDPETFSIRWTGYITAPTSGDTRLTIHADDWVRLYVDGELVIDEWEGSCCDWASTTVPLAGGTPTPIRIEYAEDLGDSSMFFAWDNNEKKKTVPVPASALSTNLGLLATYHANQTLSDPVSRRIEAMIDHDWGSGGPDAPVGKDAFSVRWTGYVTAPTTGPYTFYTRSDDGARVKIAGHTVLNDWKAHAAIADLPSNVVHLAAGVPAPIVVEYFEAAGGASMQLKWSGPNVPTEVVPTSALRPALTAELPSGLPPVIGVPEAVIVAASDITGGVVTYAAPESTAPTTCTPASGARFAVGTTPVTCTATDTSGNQATVHFAVHVTPGHGLLGEYFHNEDLSDRAFERIDRGPAFDWGHGTPDPGMHGDTFSVRWSGHITPPVTANYTFHANAEGSVRVLIGTSEFAQTACCAGVSSAPMPLTAGTATPIRIVYAEQDGAASVSLEWSATGISRRPVPSSAFFTPSGLVATYYGDTSLTTPVEGRVDPNIDYDWGLDGPTAATGTDRFSVRWTGFVIAPTTGTYTFYTRSDGGARVSIAGANVLDNWYSDGGDTEEASTHVHLSADTPTPLTVDYYEETGNASMQLKWSGPGMPKQVVPPAALTPALGPHQSVPVQIEAGRHHNCALFETGNIDCWAGQAIDSMDGDAIQVTAGDRHTCALLENGNVDCWGDNFYGQTEGYASGDAIQVTAGAYHTCALLENGNVDCWGRHTRDYAGGDAIQVTGGNDYTCALLENGSINCWGANGSGQADDYVGGDAIQVTAGNLHTCALLENGTINCWGDNSSGQADDYAGGDAIQVTAGYGHTCALLESGTINCWGYNVYGQAGDYAGGDAIQVTAGTLHTCALLEYGNIECWGNNFHDQLHSTLDQIPPSIEAHENVIIETTGPDGAPLSYTAPFGDSPVACTPDAGTVYDVGTIPVTCTASDPWGNIATSFFAIRVIPDTFAPTTTAHTEGTPGSNGWFTSPVNVTLTCADTGSGCDRSHYLLNGLAWHQGTAFTVISQGTTALDQFYSVDGLGNVEAAHVGPPIMIDMEPPVIGSHANETWEATGPDGANVSYEAPQWTDNLGDGGPAACAPAAGAAFSLGTTTVTCAAQDPAGHEATPTTFMVSVADTTAPMIDPHPDLVREAAGPNGTGVRYNAPGWSDAVSGSGTSTCAPVDNTTFALGNTTVTCSAPADSAGNEPAPTTFTVSIVDTTAPSIDAHPDLVHEATGPDGTNVTYTAPGWTDLVDGNGTSTCTPASNATFALGNTTVTCTATDAAGNTGSQTFTVSVVDTTPPRIEEHTDEVHEATGPTGANVSYLAPTWSDLVDGAGNSTCAPAANTTFGLGNNTVHCGATDAAGNEATSSFNITVQDTTPPVIAAKADETQDATAYGGATINYTEPLWHDLVDLNGTATCAPASGTFQPLGTTTVTCHAADAAGNQANATAFNVTVIPGPVAHVVVTPGNLTVNLAQPTIFTAHGFDRYGNANDTTPQWRAENGTINGNGTYVGTAVGTWQVNATMDDAVGGVLLNVTDQLRVAVWMDQAQMDPLAALATGVHGTVNVTLWDRTAQGNATVDIVVSQMVAGVGLRETPLSVTTDSDGTARFRVPDEFALAGDYQVTAAARWSGNAGDATTGYTVGL